MGLPVVLTAICKCSFGAAPTPLTVLPINFVTMKYLPAASVMEHIPFLNILPFGMCSCLGNPVVAAATAAHLGILTPMPCIPMTVSPWIPAKPNVTVAKKPILVDSAITMCTWGGVIKLLFPGVTLVTV